MNKIIRPRPFDEDYSRNVSSIGHVPERLEAVVNSIRKAYQRRHSQPWVVAYSGGKDSTLLLQLIWEVVASLPPHERRRKVYVIGNGHACRVSVGHSPPQEFYGHDPSRGGEQEPTH